jgi:hypothetical protein
MNAKILANAIRAEIKQLESRCESLKKIAADLDHESAQANPFGNKPISKKIMRRALEKAFAEQKKLAPK